MISDDAFVGISACLYILIYASLETLFLSAQKSTYTKHFAKIQKLQVDAPQGSPNGVKLELFPAGILSFLILFGVVWFFVIHDIVVTKKLRITGWVILRATMLALAIYGIYNLTNRATLKNYSWGIVLLDLAWGIFAINVVSLLALGGQKIYEVYSL
jgi:uncharacterized membrane protein